jgi:hypothetical protein
MERAHWHGLTRRLRRGAVAGGLGVVFCVCVAAAWAALLARSAPGWWVTVHRDDPGVIQTARTVENRLMSSASEDRALLADDEAWTVEIPVRDANAWLNVRLPMWLANQKDRFKWPKEMSDLQVNFADNQITIGAKVHAGDREQVLTATIEPRLGDDGRLYIPARWVSLGRLSIPAEWVLDRHSAEQYIPANLRRLPETDALFQAFSGSQAIKSNAVINLPDGRTVRILGFQTGHGALMVRCRTERREQASR